MVDTTPLTPTLITVSATVLTAAITSIIIVIIHRRNAQSSRRAPAYTSAHRALDITDKASAETLKRAQHHQELIALDLHDAVAELAMIVRKSSTWRRHPTALPELATHAERLLQAETNTDSDTGAWMHAQGIAAARVQTLLAAARSEVNRQWGARL